MASKIQTAFSFLALCACFLLSISSQLLAQETRSEQQGQSPSAQNLVRFEIYAAGLMEKYDVDEDGLLSKEEMKKMRHPPIPKFDKNTDNMISIDELVDSIRQPMAPKAEAQEDVVDTRYRKYSELLLKNYDFDKNGSLSQEEMASMRRRPPESADSNGDGQLANEELVAYLSKATSNRGKQRDGMDEIYRRLSEQVLKTSDANKNGQLDPDEIANAKWSAPWKTFDANDDGIMSRGELFARYKSMLDKTRNSESSMEGRRDAQGMRALLGAPGLNSKSDGISANSISNRPTVAGFGSVSRDKSRGSIDKKEASRVAVTLYLLRLPENIAHGSIGGVVKGIQEADDLSIVISELAKKCGGVDQVVFTSDFNTETVINSGAEVPVKSGRSQSRGGTSYQVIMHDVGLSTVVSCQKADGKIAMAVNLEKSAVVESEDATDDDFTDTKIVQWTFNSKLSITDGKPEVVASSSGKQNWLLVVLANEVQ